VGLLETSTPPALSLVPNVATSYAYDPCRRRTQAALPDGRIVNQVHDAAGRLSRTELPGAEGAIECTYDAAPATGHVHAVSGPDAAASTKIPAGRRRTSSRGSSSVFPVSSTVFPISSSVFSTPPRPPAVVVGSGGLCRGGARVSEVSRSSASEPSQRPTAQRASVPTATPIAAKKPGPPGRRLSARHVNVQPITALAPRRFVPRTLNHDANGNRVAESTTGLTRTFDHDARGTLRAVTVGGTQVKYTVDGLARRIARAENGTTTAQWLYRDALRIAAELDGQGALRWRFVYASGRHVPDAAIDAGGVMYRIVTDQVGSLRLVVRASDGAVMQRMRHDAWGNVEEDFVAAGFARVPFAHERNSAGGLVDQVTGLVHFGAREYDPVVGRWVEKDPIRWAGGTTGLYEYVGSAPVGRVDPSGLWLVQLGVQGGGGLGFLVGVGGKLTGGIYFGKDGGRWKLGAFAQTAFATPSSGAVVGASAGVSPVAGYCPRGGPSDFAGPGWDVGAETEFNTPPLGPIPPLDLRGDLQLDPSGVPTGLQVSATPEQLNHGTDLHEYSTDTAVVEWVK
jgi:RHS repeat-associated protein